MNGFGQAGWLTTVISASQEVEIGMVFEASLSKSMRLKNKLGVVALGRRITV
jgi:hypothetical protein